MATIKRKQLKRAYKIPRSLKKAIRKNLVKIVKERERKICDEEVSNSLVPSRTSCTSRWLSSAIHAHTVYLKASY
jgi:response regulator of citrate/malate metabolism